MLVLCYKDCDKSSESIQRLKKSFVFSKNVPYRVVFRSNKSNAYLEIEISEFQDA